MKQSSQGGGRYVHLEIALLELCLNDLNGGIL